MMTLLILCCRAYTVLYWASVVQNQIIFSSVVSPDARAARPQRTSRENKFIPMHHRFRMKSYIIIKHPPWEKNGSKRETRIKIRASETYTIHAMYQGRYESQHSFRFRRAACLRYPVVRKKATNQSTVVSPATGAEAGLGSGWQRLSAAC
jgi:hypothetical protein